MESKKKTDWVAWLLGGVIWGALIVLLIAGSGCAGLDYVGQRAAERAESVVESYCSLPRSTRAIVRWEGNEAVKERGVMVVGCKGEEDYDRLRAVFVEPYSASTIDSIIAEVLARGAYTMPDGSVIRLVVDGPEGE